MTNGLKMIALTLSLGLFGFLALSQLMPRDDPRIEANHSQRSPTQAAKKPSARRPEAVRALASKLAAMPPNKRMKAAVDILNTALFDQHWSQVEVLRDALQIELERSDVDRSDVDAPPASIEQLEQALARARYQAERGQQTNHATRTAATGSRTEQLAALTTIAEGHGARGSKRRAWRSAVALLGLRGEAGLPALASLLKARLDAEELEAVTEAIAYNPDSKAFTALLTYSEAHHPSAVRAACLRALALRPESCRGLASEKLRSALLEDREPSLLIAACDCLAQVGFARDLETHRALGLVLGNPTENQEVRRAALSAFVASARRAEGTPAALIEPIESLLRDGSERALEGAAIDALALVGRPESIAALELARPGLTDPRHRAQLDKALKRLRQRHSVD